MSLDTASAVVKVRSLTNKFDLGVRNATPFYPRISTIIPSDGADEEYGMMGSVPAIREWLDDRQFYTPRAAKFTLKNKLWEGSERIEKTDIRDDRLALYGPRLEQLGQRATRHPDKLLLSTVVINGTSSLCYDGQFFFDTDHAFGSSGTQSNSLSIDIVDPTAPTIDEFNSALSQALNAMMGFKDDQGELLQDDVLFANNQEMQLLLLVPLAYRNVAIKCQSAGILINNGQTNVVTVVAEVVSSARMTGNIFDLYRVDTPFKPYVFQAREPLSRQMKGMDDIEFKDVKFMTQARYNLGYGAWWNAVRVTFT